MTVQYSKLIVALIILLNVGFTGAVLYLFLRTGSEPTALIAAWFAFTTGELWLLAGIRKKKMDGGDVDAGNRNEYKV